jgi:TP901 family phage tail tape measure protein
MDAEQSIAALPVVTDFATAGAFDLATATDLLTDAQSALGLSSKDATENMEGMTRLSDILVKANTLANASVQQFSEALTNEAGAAIRQYNLDLTDSVGVLAAYADQGIKGQKAGSMFGRSVRLLTKAAKDNAKEFKKMGIEVFDSEGEFRKFSSITADMEKALGKLSTEEKAAALETLGFQARVQQAILPLIGASAKIKEYDEALKGAAGTTGDISEKQMKTFNNQVKMLKNNFNALVISVGKELMPLANDILKWLKDATNEANALFTIAQKMGGFRKIASETIAGGAESLLPSRVDTFAGRGPTVGGVSSGGSLGGGSAAGVLLRQLEVLEDIKAATENPSVNRAEMGV